MEIIRCLSRRFSGNQIADSSASTNNETEEVKAVFAMLNGLDPERRKLAIAQIMKLAAQIGTEQEESLTQSFVSESLEEQKGDPKKQNGDRNEDSSD